MKIPPRRSSGRDSYTSEIQNPTTSRLTNDDISEGDPAGFPSFSSIDPDSFDFLPQSEEPLVLFSPLETEVDADDSLAERLDAFGAGNSSGGKKLFQKLSLRESLFETFVSQRGFGFLLSILIHLLVLILLAILVFSVKNGSHGEPVQAGFSEKDELSLTESAGEDIDASDLEFSGEIDPLSQPEFLAQDIESTEPSAGEFEAVSEDIQRLEQSGTVSDGMGLLETVTTGKATSGRNAETRKHGLPGREGDTTDESEGAVEAGLAWLAEHQLPDGGWAFDLTAEDDHGLPGTCGGLCSNSVGTSGAMVMKNGLYPSRVAATGIALLPFLGAGYDHRQPGLYQKTVEAGIGFLKYRARQTKSGVDFRDPGERYGMYTQAIVAVTLCEAYELTGDPELKYLAEESTKFVAMSQRDDGGWRYEAVSDNNYFSYAPGDTSVSGWQMLALKSAVSAGFELPPETFYKVGYFLDTVQEENNTLYRYMAVSRESGRKIWGTTAVGLLIREYLGWGPDRKEIKRGMKNMLGWFDALYTDWKWAKKGNIEDKEGREIVKDGRFVYNLYFAYYATIALHHFGGQQWHKTFAKTREFLIETQNNGEYVLHEKGSWLFYDRYLNDGGRLLNTAIAVLILETPYRYLPMYK